MFKLSCSDICGVTCVNNIIKQKRNILKWQCSFHDLSAKKYSCQ
jgi:hypothetical protein